MAATTPTTFTGTPMPEHVTPASFISDIEDRRLRFLTQELFRVAHSPWPSITPLACYDALRANNMSIQLALDYLSDQVAKACRPWLRPSKEKVHPQDIAIQDIRSIRLQTLTRKTRDLVMKAKPGITNRACRDAVLLNRMSITAAIDSILADDEKDGDAPPTFPQFAKFPCELRLAIWREATLEANKDRIVLMDHHRDRCLRVSDQLRPAAVFMATRESRQVARSIYTTRLDVFSLCTFGTDGAVGAANEADFFMEEYDPVDFKHMGVVYISLQHDRFAAIEPDDEIYEEDYDLTGLASRLTSSRLSRQDLAYVENIMQIETLMTGDLWNGADCDECMERWHNRLEEPCEGCGGYHDYALDLETIYSTCEHVPPFDYFVEQVCDGVCHSLCMSNYPSLRSCVHLWVDADRDADPSDILQAICDEPASEVMLSWEEHIRKFDLEDVLRSLTDHVDDDSEYSMDGVSPGSGCL